MKKVVRMTENDLNKIVKRVINENVSDDEQFMYKKLFNSLETFDNGIKKSSRRLNDVTESYRQLINKSVVHGIPVDRGQKEQHITEISRLLKNIDGLLNEVKNDFRKSI